LLDLPRSNFYYKPVGESEYNLLLMRIIDEQYTLTPFYGVPKMTEFLRIQGHPVGPKRVRRLMRLMGLEAIYPKPKLSKKGAVSGKSPKYPYLLKGLTIDRVNQVWTTDITYIRLRRGFVYLVAVMDWFSRYVISWEVSNSLDSFFCVWALDKALQRFVPEIFNSLRRDSQSTKAIGVASSPVRSLLVVWRTQRYLSVGMAVEVSGIISS